ncbi:MAG: DUF3099 domain-containing protein [Actinobacteria bacterium]|nr:DUF3099 domain-containing protein [Actinomycetota bacterium]
MNGRALYWRALQDVSRLPTSTLHAPRHIVAVVVAVAVVAITVLHRTVVGWILVIVAVVLPYFAVVVANATRPRGARPLHR